MTNQSKIDKSIVPEETQIMQKAPEEAHIEQKVSEEEHIEQEAPKEAHVCKNCEILVNYVHTGEKWIEIILLLTIFSLSKSPLIS